MTERHGFRGLLVFSCLKEIYLAAEDLIPPRHHCRGQCYQFHDMRRISRSSRALVMLHDSERHTEGIAMWRWRQITRICGHTDLYIHASSVTPLLSHTCDHLDTYLCVYVMHRTIAESFVEADMYFQGLVETLLQDKAG